MHLSPLLSCGDAHLLTGSSVSSQLLQGPAACRSQEAGILFPSLGLRVSPLSMFHLPGTAAVQARRELQAEQQGLRRQLRHTVARQHAHQGRASRLVTARSTAQLAAEKHRADTQVAALRDELQEQGRQAAILKAQVKAWGQQPEGQVAGLDAQLQADVRAAKLALSPA